MKLWKERWRVCSIWQIFFNWSLRVSIIDRFLNKILSWRCIREFFIFFLILVINCILSTNSSSKRLWDRYPLSAKSFPNSFSWNFLSLSGHLSSTFAWVIRNSIISALSLITKCSLKPKNQPTVLALGCYALKDFVGMFPFNVADSYRSRIHKRDTRTVPQTAQLQENDQWQQYLGL